MGLTLTAKAITANSDKRRVPFGVPSVAAKCIAVLSPRRGMELTMAIADWIREATEKRRRRIRREAYMMGYEDRDKGKPPRPPTNGTSPNGNGDNGVSK